MYWVCPNSRAVREGVRGGARIANRDAFRALVEAGPPPGLIAYDFADPVAWARVTPRAMLPGLRRARDFKISGEGADIWSISRVAVRRAWRRRGLTGAAIPVARSHGAQVLEAYAYDRAGSAGPLSPVAAWTGIASAFARAGFAVVAGDRPAKVLMRRAL